jgi:hypothetical protein
MSTALVPIGTKQFCQQFQKVNGNWYRKERLINLTACYDTYQQARRFGNIYTRRMAADALAEMQAFTGLTLVEPRFLDVYV